MSVPLTRYIVQAHGKLWGTVTDYSGWALITGVFEKDGWVTPYGDGSGWLGEPRLFETQEEAAKVARKHQPCAEVRSVEIAL